MPPIGQTQLKAARQEKLGFWVIEMASRPEKSSGVGDKQYICAPALPLSALFLAGASSSPSSFSAPPTFTLLGWLSISSGEKYFLDGDNQSQYCYLPCGMRNSWSHPREFLDSPISLLLLLLLSKSKYMHNSCPQFLSKRTGVVDIWSFVCVYLFISAQHIFILSWWHSCFSLGYHPFLPKSQLMYFR